MPNAKMLNEVHSRWRYGKYVYVDWLQKLKTRVHHQRNGRTGDHRHRATDKADGDDGFPARANLVQLFIQRVGEGDHRRLQQIV